MTAVAVGLLLALAAPVLAGPPSLTPAQLAALPLTGYPRSMAPPEFGLRTADGRLVSLAGLRGKVVVLNFWATWCRECLTEMPALETLHRRHALRGLAIVGIGSREGAAAVRRYATEHGLTFPLLLDPDGAVSARFGVVGLPTTFLIGRDGNAMALAVGPRDWTSPRALDVLDTLLGGRREPPR